MSVRFSVLLICVVLAAPLQTGEVGINKPTLGKVALATAVFGARSAESRPQTPTASPAATWVP